VLGSEEERASSLEALNAGAGFIKRDLRARLQALLSGQEAPTLAAVDLAERQTVAGGYSQPARTQLSTTPVATYSLIASFVAVFIVEKVLLRTSNGLFDMGALSNVQPDWWRFVAYAFLHEPSGSTFGLQGLPVHLLFNSFATYIVGRLVEQLYGWRVLLATFLATAVGAGIASVLVATVTKAESATIGASGGIMGLLGLLFVLGRVQGRVARRVGDGVRSERVAVNGATRRVHARTPVLPNEHGVRSEDLVDVVRIGVGDVRLPIVADAELDEVPQRPVAALPGLHRLDFPAMDEVVAGHHGG